MNLSSILSILCPVAFDKYMALQEQVQCQLPVKDVNNTLNEFEKYANVSSYKTSKTFISFFNCILDQLGCDVPTDFESQTNDLSKLMETLDTYNFNTCFNIPKLINIISQNTINNELVVFLSGFFNINICIS